MAMFEDGSMEVTVNKAELLARLKENRENHAAEAAQAEAAWKAAVVAALTVALRDAVEDKAHKTSFDLPRPPNHTKDYDRVIKMLEMSTKNEITISSTQFMQFVEDDWSWKHQFKAATSRYGL